MKYHIRILLAFLGCFSLVFVTGCATQAGGIAIASGEQGIGALYANSKLAKVDPSPAGTAAQKAAVADLQRVSTDLSAFVAGKLTFGELGAVEAQLQADKVALSSNTAAVSDITSILNIFAQNLGSGANGVVLPQQAIASQVVADVNLGVTNAVNTFEGRWSITNPTVWTVPSS
jgi:hypothetical protein